MHPYYTVLLAPAIAALTGVGVAQLARGRPWIAACAGLTCAGWEGWLTMNSRAEPAWLLMLVVAVSVVGTLTLAFRSRWAIALMMIALLSGQLATCVATDLRAVTDPNPLAGPGPSQPHRPAVALASFIRTHRGSALWGAAVVSALPAASLQLDSGVPVLPIGGFSGRIPSPTLTGFQQLIRSGELRYVVLSGPYRTVQLGRTPAPLVGTQAARVLKWVESVGRPVTAPADGIAVYDLEPERRGSAGWSIPAR
jgi:hypothetical protein